jgi:hypothetical protein
VAHSRVCRTGAEMTAWLVCVCLITYIMQRNLEVASRPATVFSIISYFTFRSRDEQSSLPDGRRKEAR